jgi:hypothetical protein
VSSDFDTHAMANDIERPVLASGRAQRHRLASRSRDWLAGGTDGNERLTTLTGLLLIGLLAVLGVTIVRIGQLLWLHLFLGLVLLGPVALKLASTGYRFVRYYTGDTAYRRKGPPVLALRALGPVVVLLTLTVFATGVALLLLGRGSRDPLVLIHKVSFFAWLALTALHVLGHLPEIMRLGAARESRRKIIALDAAHTISPDSGVEDRSEGPTPGERARVGALGASVLVGLVVAVALLGQFSAWTH